MTNKKHIIDKVTDDNTKIVLSNKSIKWIIGLLTFGVMGILGFAWGLYIKVYGEMMDMKNMLQKEMNENQIEVLHELKDLKDGQVKINQLKNHDQDLDIVRLLERTNSREIIINGNSERPTTTNNNTDLPNLGQ